LRQTIAPDAWLGRINGSFRVIDVGATIAGSLIAAWTGTALGLRITMWSGAVLIAIAALICLFASRVPVPASTTSPVRPE
jgi:hypothetical protein